MWNEHCTARSLHYFSTPKFYDVNSIIPAGVDTTITIHSKHHAIFPQHQTRGCPDVSFLNKLLHKKGIKSQSIGFHWEGNKVQGPYHKGYFLVVLNKTSKKAWLMKDPELSAAIFL